MDSSQPALSAAAGAAGSTSADKRALLKSLLLSSSRPAGSAARLSEAQARLWEIETHESTPGIHDFSLAYALRGALDTEILEKALRAVAGRHATLRSRIVNRGEETQFEELPLTADPLIEIRRAGEDLADLVLAEAARPLVPTSGRGWRAVLFRISPEEHTLLLHFHHIFADRWSVAVLVSDLSTAYRALREGREASLAPVPREAEEASLTDSDLSYWRRIFAQAPEPLRLPLALSGPAFADYAGARIEFEIDAPTSEGLKSAAAGQSTTLFAALMAGFAGFLHAHTGQEDLVLCTPMTGRHRGGTRSAIGYFNNILPMRLDLSGDPEFQTVISRAAVEARDIFAAQDVPFHRIAGLPELAGRRITQCLVTLQNIPGLELEIPDIASSYRDVPNGTANFDLALFAEEKDGRLRCLLDYKSALLERAAAEKLKDRLLEFLHAVAERPASRLSGLPRYSLPAPAKTQGTTASTSRSIHNMADDRMIALWQKVFPRLAVNADSDFFAIGGDSMKAARLFAIIQREAGIELPLVTLFEAPTPRQMVERIGDRDWVAPWLSLVPIQTAGSRPPLFCVHGGGGHVLSFRFIAGCLQDQPVYGLQAQGLKTGELPFNTVEEMARYYLQSVRALRPHGPYLLTGHSLGAVVAYEMAQLLAAEGEEVPFLGLLDHPGPGVRLSWRDWLRFHLWNLSMLSLRDRWSYVTGALAWRCRFLLAGLRLSKAPLPSEKPAGRGAIDVLEQALRALRDYRIRPYPGKLFHFRAERAPQTHSDESGGWGGVAAQGVEVHEVPGTHMTMFGQPHVRGLGEAIGHCLDRIAGSVPLT